MTIISKNDVLHCVARIVTFNNADSFMIFLYAEIPTLNVIKETLSKLDLMWKE